MHVTMTLYASQYEGKVDIWNSRLTYNPPNQNTKKSRTFLRTGTCKSLMTKKGRARITTSKSAFGSSKMRTISPYETQRVAGWILSAISYAALIGVHPNTVRHTATINHAMHKAIVMVTHRMRFGFVMNRE